MSELDLLIILAFLLATLVIGVVERKQLTLKDYWVNSRSTGTFTLMATMLSTFIGAATLFALSSIAYSGGVAALIIGASFVFYFILFALLVAPRIKRLGDRIKAYTIPDIMAVRYSPSARLVSGLINLIIYALFLAVQFLAVGSFINLFAGFNLILSTLLGGLVMIAYTSVGGLRADIRTDVFQFFVMLVLIVIFLPLLVARAGGLNALTALPPNYFTGTAFAGPPILVAAFLFLGLTILSSMDVWQRAFAGKDEHTVKWGMFWAGLFTIPFFTLAAAIGMFGKVLFPEIDPNLLVVKELVEVLPPGLLGLSVAGFFAAIMSSADTSLLIVSQTLVHDFYQSFFNQRLTEEQTFRLSRWVTLIVGIVALLTATIFLSILNLAISAVSLGVALIPAIIGVFFWKRATSKGAVTSMVVGALTVFALMPTLKEQAFIPGFLVSLIVLVVVSLLTKHGSSEKLQLI